MDNKIVIELTNANKPPKVTVDGEVVKVKNIEYYYDSDQIDYQGVHELLASISNNEKNQFDKIGFEK